MRSWDVVRWWPGVRRVDAGLVALLAAQLAEIALSRPEGTGVAALALVVMATGVLLVRRAVPLATAVGVPAGHAALMQVLPHTPGTVFLGAVVGAVVLGGLPTVPARIGLAGLVGLAAIGAWLDRYGGGVGDAVLTTAVLAGAWTAGMLLTRRSRAARQARSRADRAEAGARAAASEAVATERARVTRELHDVVAHGLTVVVLQTVAAREDVADGSSGADLMPRLDAIEESARVALADLRTLLGVLRGAGDPAGDVPVESGLSGIRRLVERAGAARGDVALEVTGDPRGLDAGIELAALRVVQEGLTNALRHGDGPNSVRVDFGERELTVEVVSTGRATISPGTGRGLPGIRERAAMFGGTCEAEPTDDGFLVRCVLPTVAPA